MSKYGWAHTVIDDPKGRLWKYGRFYVCIYKQPGNEYGERYEFGVSWCLRRTSCAIGITASVDDGHKMQYHLGIPLLGEVFVHHPLPAWIERRLPRAHSTYKDVPFSYPLSRKIDVYVYAWSLWWRVWTGTDGWTAGEFPRWREGSWDMREAVLGRRQYHTQQTQAPFGATVEMPEGRYPVTVSQSHAAWWFPRWPWYPLRIERTTWDIDCPIGIPFPGKGENSYDCGEDGLYGTGFDVHTHPTIDEACRAFALKVLEYRRRYGGAACAREPWPESPAVRQQAWNARRIARAAEQGTQQEPQR